jgi:hypothetical protein
MKASPQRKVAYTIAIVAVAIPVVIMIWDIEVGVFLLLVGLGIATRAIRYRAHNDPPSLSAAGQQQLSRRLNEQGRTIFVQVVDDFGRDLPPATVQKLMADAQAQASPLDTVVPIRHKISREDGGKSKE